MDQKFIILLGQPTTNFVGLVLTKFLPLPHAKDSYGRPLHLKQWDRQADGAPVFPREMAQALVDFSPDTVRMQGV